MTYEPYPPNQACKPAANRGEPDRHGPRAAGGVRLRDGVAGRNTNRSILIKNDAGRDGFDASWEKLFDGATRTLACSSTATWDRVEQWQATPRSTADSRVAAATALFRVGRYHDTIKALVGIELADFGADAWDVAETLCLAYARLGMKPETLQARTSLARFATHRFHELAVFISAFNNLGLSPPLRDLLSLNLPGMNTSCLPSTSTRPAF